jgi:hypothetical protein
MLLANGDIFVNGLKKIYGGYFNEKNKSRCFDVFSGHAYWGFGSCLCHKILH